MISGSCLCGDVAFEIDESGIVTSNNCSCANCRKVSGAGHGTFLQLKPSCFRWTSDPSKVATYESSPGNHRAFCPRCGSRAPQHGRLPVVGVPAGALDSDPGVRPEVAFYAASDAPWCVAEVTGKAYAQAPPPEFLDEFMSRLR
ncbi:MAG TPA: GFA family protein [Caulobacteraceae bacterium]|nr:GFA family protein [Caulobacteraceae bacterium]